MSNEKHNIAGRLTSGGTMASSLLRFSRGAANVSLPGFAQFGDMAKELLEHWKTADQNDNEFAWLDTRLKDLCSLIHEFDMVEHPDVYTASRKFQDLKNSLAESERRPRSGIQGAEQKQRLLDNLNREIDRVVEMTLLRLALGQAQSNEPNPIDNFQVISAHEITDQIPVYNATYPDPLVPASGSVSWLSAPDCPAIIRSIRRARFGSVPVRYKTFSSRSDSRVAAKAAEAELKYLSRCLHPNVAKIIGVTKGYDGLNGYAVAEDGVPLDQFLLRVNSGAALVQFIRGVEDLRANRMDNLAYYFHSNHVTVKPNGQLTVFPLVHPGGGYGMNPYFSLSEDDRAALNPAIREFLAIYNQMETHGESLYKLYDSVVTLGWESLTELEMARLAAKYKLLPDARSHNWRGPNVPPYTTSVGDIGYVLSQDRRDTWSPIQLSKCVPGIQGICRCWCNLNQNRGAYTEGYRWISRYYTYCLSDFWDYKYEEMLQSGLASIPGSYPGSYVEEVSEDEAAEDESSVPPL